MTFADTRLLPSRKPRTLAVIDVAEYAKKVGLMSIRQKRMLSCMMVGNRDSQSRRLFQMSEEEFGSFVRGMADTLGIPDDICDQARKSFLRAAGFIAIGNRTKALRILEAGDASKLRSLSVERSADTRHIAEMYEELTPPARDIADALADGMKYPQLCQKFNLPLSTMRVYVSRVYRALELPKCRPEYRRRIIATARTLVSV